MERKMLITKSVNLVQACHANVMTHLSSSAQNINGSKKWKPSSDCKKKYQERISRAISAKEIHPPEIVEKKFTYAKGMEIEHARKK